jgi:hypothetical protein
MKFRFVSCRGKVRVRLARVCRTIALRLVRWTKVLENKAKPMRLRLRFWSVHDLDDSIFVTGGSMESSWIQMGVA